MTLGKTHIVGILNVTPDSFFDGGKFFDTNAAVARARAMIAEGVDVIDIGAESTHPDSRDVTAEEELAVLEPIITELKKSMLGEDPEIILSVDTYKPEVMRACLALGITLINDISGLKDPEAIALLAKANVPVVVMYSTASKGKADKKHGEHEDLPERIVSFFEKKTKALEVAGIKKENIIIDPGMGFFLGSNPEPSLKVLKHLDAFKALGYKTYISTSNKSFIGSITGKELGERGAGTLATELWAALSGVDYIRTHDVAALRDGLMMLDSIQSIT